MPNLKIGQVAETAGVGVDTVRYYERLGLLPAAPRRASGYRVFDESTIERIELIKELQDLGLSLQEIGEMFRTGPATCAGESDTIRAALERTEAMITSLVAVKAKLEATLGRCERGECAIVPKLSRVRTATHR